MSQSQVQETPLSYTEENTTASGSTILFIHGAFSSSQEWDLVTPLLKTHHLLLPDLPSHGSSRNTTPFSVSRSTTLLAELIKAKAKTGKAHLVGLSLGAHIALHLASTHPTLVLTVLVSGFEVFPRSALTPALPYLLWLSVRLENLVPRSVVAWLMDGADIRRADVDVVTLALCRQIAASMFQGGGVWPAQWRARTLVVAAGKRGILPTADHPGDAKRLVEIARGGGEEGVTIAVTHGAIRHPWNRQMPLLFAECVRGWIEEGSVAAGFERL